MSKITERINQSNLNSRVVNQPTKDYDVANKKYVDTKAGFTNLNAVTGSRAVDTVYQNQNVFPILVVVSLEYGVVDDSAHDGNLAGTTEANALCENANPPTVEVGRTGLNIDLSGLASSLQQFIATGTMTFVVPAGYYYEVSVETTGEGVAPSISVWIEYGGEGTAA